MDGERQPANHAALAFNGSLITGGTFNLYRPLQDNPSSGLGFSTLDQALRRLPLLEDHIVVEAMLNAAARYPQPQCDPDTRRLIQGIVKGWICSGGEGSGERIMWLSGAPGVGKSAVVQTVCMTLAAEGGNNPVKCCNFFGRGEGRREKAIYLPATIAYHISTAVTGFRLVVDQSIRINPTVFSQSLDSQFQKLLLDPVAHLHSETPLNEPITVVIDALDEVDDVRDQVALLELIFKAVTQLPMRFLIASRPEQPIYTFFHRPDVLSHVHHIRLDEENFKTSRDIYTFLAKSFARIRQSRPGSFPMLPNREPWPGDPILRRLTAYSDAQFIFPHLIVESIDADPFTSPHEQLQSILEHTASDVFSKLDALYHEILSRCLKVPVGRRDRNKALLISILRAIICWPEELSIAGIADVLDEETFVVEGIIRGPMRSLFKIEDDDPNSRVALCHKSLRDCVLNRSRAGEFFIPSDEPDKLYNEILSRWNRGHSSECNKNKFTLMGVLRVIISRRGTLSPINYIASVLNEETSAVEGIIHGPMSSLFKLYPHSQVYLCHETLENYVLDRSRAGEFFISSINRDELYLEVLSRPPPPEPRNSFPPHVLTGVLQCIQCFTHMLTMRAPLELIASILTVEPNVVWNVFLGPQRSLFTGSEVDVQLNCRAHFSSFLADIDRSGEFAIPYSKATTIVFHKILSIPPPCDPNKAFSRQDLMGVLRVTRMWYNHSLTLPETASVLGIRLDTLENILDSPQSCLLKVTQFWSGGPRWLSLASEVAGFLQDETLSREFHVSQESEDALLVSILSRPPPSDPQQSFSRDDLRRVLHTIPHFLHGLTIPRIASILSIDPRVVENVIYGPQRFLFGHVCDGVYFMATVDLAFFRDASRSGAFYLSETDAASLLALIYSHPLPPESPFTRQHRAFPHPYLRVF